MPSIQNMIIGAAALAGMATAFPQAAPYGNGTHTNGTSAGGVSTGGISVPKNNTSNNSAFCPTLNGQVYIDGLDVAFLIQCETSHFGTIIEIDINATLARRQASVAPTSLGNCLDLCAENAICVGAAFNSDLQTCALYSDVGAEFNAPEVSFGIVIARDATPAAGTGSGTGSGAGAGAGTGAGAITTIPAGGVATSTIYSTSVATIYSCAPTVTNCPLRAAGANGGSAVVTQIIPVSTTTYICPSATVIPATPVACGCAYGASTVGAYSATVVSGSTVIQQITSTVIAVPSPSNTQMSATTCAATAFTTYPAVATNAAVCAGCPSTITAVGSAASTGFKAAATSSMAVFEGAASQMKAGVGAGAIIAAAALLL